MSAVRDRIESALAKLARTEGFTRRDDQRQLALLLSDLIEGETTGAFEAPTGLGKSLAALIPAIAHAIVHRKRTVIATYTNVLAEQYWRRDLPLALSLFDDAPPRTQFLIGRQRYVCLAALEERDSGLADGLANLAELGIETEFRQAAGLRPSEASRLWKEVAIPPVCPARLCPRYNACFYYKARRQAERAEIVITNHSVVIQDALLKDAAPDAKGLLGDYDFLIVDEAHDFPNAAAGGLEIEVSERTLSATAAIAVRVAEIARSIGGQSHGHAAFTKRLERLHRAIERAKKDLTATSLMLTRPGILATSPSSLVETPGVKANLAVEAEPVVAEATSVLADELESFTGEAMAALGEWAEEGAPKDAADSMATYLAYLDGYAHGCRDILKPSGVAVSHIGSDRSGTAVRLDVLDLATPLRRLVWERGPWACLSATLALDGSFQHYKRITGAQPEFEEILPSPFDFGTQCALYLPPVGSVPDPGAARRDGFEEQYYAAIAHELTQIIEAVGGRTLALFHSRKELDGVLVRMRLSDDLPIYVQDRSGAGSAGERFRKTTRSSLFALRSFWTGFDAPGETLSCVVLVRVPFEVPVEPSAVARMAWLESRGENAFGSHTLPNAKMLMRQGAGRLIRTSEDRGLVAILDPRMRTKRYGEEILANLPPEMRCFDDLGDALGHVGIEGAISRTCVTGR